VVIGEDLKYSDGTSVGSRNEFGTGSRNSKGGGPDLRQDDVIQLTASTAKGQTYQFTLPDGTKVWLNADSKLEFPSGFVNSKTRDVRLFGEGYFEVAKDKAHPFIVRTNKQEVEVLGTHFNINSYADEGNVKTTLLEGSVRVNGQGRESVVLKPNQQAVVFASKQTEVNSVDVGDVVAWKNGKFVFVRENVRSIMNKIARWYDVQIIYEGDVKGKALGGSVSRFKNVSEVLEMLSATKAVQFRIEGRKVIVMPFKE
jgi:ferric-dicitrate binding protein FerR (iron transport regulator)